MQVHVGNLYFTLTFKVLFDNAINSIVVFLFVQLFRMQAIVLIGTAQSRAQIIPILVIGSPIRVLLAHRLPRELVFYI